MKRSPRGSLPILVLPALLGACTQNAVAPDEPLATGRRGHLGPVTSVVPFADDFASCSQAGVARALPESGAEIVPGPFRVFALAPLDEATLVAAGGAPGRSGEVALLGENATLRQRVLAGDVCYAVAVAPDRGRIAVGDAGGRVRVLAAATLEELQVEAAHTAPCRALAFTPTGDCLVSAGLDGVVRLQDAAGTPRRVNDHTAGVECLAIDAQGTRVASGARDGKVRIHGLDGRLRRTFGRLGAAVLALAWCDEQRLVCGTEDGRVLLLEDAGDGAVRELRRDAGAVHALAVAGGRLAVGHVGLVRAWPLPGR